MQLYLINTKKNRNINQLHINTFTYQKKLRTFKTKTANIYQCFFLGTNKAEYPTIYSLYFLYYYLKSDLKYRKFNLYVCTFNNTYKKGKIPRFKHVMQFQKIQESQSFLRTLFWRGSLQFKKMVSMVFMARLDGLRFCSVVACITFYQCFKRNRESILRTERRLAFAIFNTNFPMHFSVFLRIFNTGVQTEP